MNWANKKVKKTMRNLKQGDSTFFPWAIISLGGLDGRPEGPAYVGIHGKVFHCEPQPAGLKITRESDELHDAVLNLSKLGF